MYLDFTIGLIPLYLGFLDFSGIWATSHLLFIVLSRLCGLLGVGLLALRVFSLVSILPINGLSHR